MERTNKKTQNKIIRFFVYSILLALIGSYFMWRKTYEITYEEDVITIFFRENYAYLIGTLVGQLPVFILVFSAVFSAKKSGKRLLVAAFIIEVIQFGYNVFLNTTSIKNNIEELGEHHSYESNLNTIGFLINSCVWTVGLIAVIVLLIIACVKLIKNHNIRSIATGICIIMLICVVVDIVVGIVYLINNELDLYCDYGNSYVFFYPLQLVTNFLRVLLLWLATVKLTSIVLDSNNELLIQQGFNENDNYSPIEKNLNIDRRNNKIDTFSPRDSLSDLYLKLKTAKETLNQNEIELLINDFVNYSTEYSLVEKGQYTIQFLNTQNSDAFLKNGVLVIDHMTKKIVVFRINEASTECFDAFLSTDLSTYYLNCKITRKEDINMIIPAKPGQKDNLVDIDKKINGLNKLNEMKKQGLITDDEFEKLKEELLYEKEQ